jgi:FtsP/CotA-like multicopper oxidase with cupredoxin domain
VLFCGACTVVPALATLSGPLPGRISMAGHQADYGGGPAGGHDHAGTSVAALTGPDLTGAGPVRRFTLTAAETSRSAPRGEGGQGGKVWAFNGQVPGPELRVRQGDVVEVTLVNRLPEDGVTLHWHGVDVPNAMDGVAGVTQDAVQPGQRFTYRFRAEDAGSYWYHSHQQSAEQVRRGLFGVFIVEPAAAPAGTFDLAVVRHDGRGTAASAGGETDTRFAVEPGRRVRARLINAGNNTARLAVRGATVRVLAIDGTDLRGPTDLAGVAVKIGGGGRYDVGFTMPDHPVAVGDIVLSPDGKAKDAGGDAGQFDPAGYGQPAASPFDRFDRNFTVVLDERFGTYDGNPALRYTVNGKSFPDVPMLMVRTGDAVRTRFVNRSGADHPMHLHGHHMLVLTRNGKPTTGSPWWVDTLTVSPGETYEVAFRADNPGLWMDHCHNLPHAATGMVLHLGYQGVSSPYEVGRDTPNQPE